MISFFNAIHSFNKVLFSELFYIIRIINFMSVIGSVGHLIPTGLALFSMVDPIHTRSVCFQLILRPEMSLKKSSNSNNNCSAELMYYMSYSTAVVSSAYFKIFIFSFLILVNLIPWFQRIATARVSTTTIKKVRGEWIPLPNTSFEWKIIWSNTIVHYATFL